MLPATTFSTISGASTSLSGDVEFEIVEQIIERAPRSATCWPQVYRAYGEVLEENGLSAATDAAYYQILLKLGVIRAPTYGERWNLWKATHSIFIHPTASPRRPRVSSGREAEVRSRVPFLASVSSDLDEGFDGEGESLMGHARPSPRKELAKDDRSRSLVGYTPSQSVDYDVVTLNPPIRTSTPVYAQEQGYGRATPPLPPYSISEVDESLYEPDSRLAESLLTPRPASAPWPGRKDDLHDEVIREMERRADEFYRTGMVGRCWDVWHRAVDWFQETTYQIDAVRNRIVLQQTLIKWRNMYQNVLDLPNTADAHRAHHLQYHALQVWLRRSRDQNLARREKVCIDLQGQKRSRKAWRSWRMELVRRRTERWQRDMRHREREFVGQKAEMLLQTAFQRWHDETRDRAGVRTADSFFAQKVLSVTLDYWLDAMHRKRHLEVLLANYKAQHDTDAVTSLFAEWQHRTILQVSHGKVTATRHRAVLKRALDQWRMTRFVVSSSKDGADGHRWHEHLATSFSERHVLSRAVRGWRKRLRDIQVLKRKALALHQRQDAVLLRTIFDIWAIAERGQLLLRIHDTRLVRQTWATWQAKQTAIRALDASAQHHVSSSARRTLHRAFSRWRGQLSQHQTLALRADLVREGKLTSSTLLTWVAASRRLQMNVVTAEKARAFFLQRLVVRSWRDRLAGRHQSALVERRRLKDLGAAFSRWRERTAQHRLERRMIDEFQQTQEKRLLSSTLSMWTERIIELKSRELDIVERRNVTILGDAIFRWSRAAKRVANLKGLMQSFIDVRTEESLKRVLAVWRDRALHAKDRRVQAEHAMAERDSRLVAEAFFTWSGRLREGNLRDIEEQVALRHEDAVLFEVWDNWKARSTRLPAITFVKTRSKRLGWQTWRRALAGRREVNAAVAPRERRMLEDTFAQWSEASRRKAAIRSTRLRGRLRPVSLALDPPRRRSAGPTFSSAIPPIAPRRSIPHARSTSTSRQLQLDPPRGRVDRPTSSESVVSEPAYSRLRSELGRRRGASEEPVDAPDACAGSDLLRALRGTLPGR